MNILILGYGSAGRRHHKSLIEILGEETKLTIYDPVSHRDESFIKQEFELVVIASPPKYHFQQASFWLDRDALVMCEKPLCDIGQIDQASELLSHPNIGNMMVSYNYRWNPDLKDVTIHKYLEISSVQHRQSTPDWGFLLDHVSHDLDIVRFNIGDIGVDQAIEVVHDGYFEYLLSGKSEDGHYSFRISDRIHTEMDHVRHACLISDLNCYGITANERMFHDMWVDFLDGHRVPVEEAYKTQLCLEQAYNLIHEIEDNE